MHIFMRTAALAAALPALAVGQSRPNEVSTSNPDSVQIERLTSLEFPWGMAYLPDGRLLITEKPGRLRIFADGTLSDPIENVPTVSYREGPSEQEFEPPVRTWTPVISPSGALCYDGAMFPWRGHVIVGGLSSQAVVRLALEGDKIIGEHRIEMKKRIRDVIQARDG